MLNLIISNYLSIFVNRMKILHKYMKKLLTQFFENIYTYNSVTVFLKNLKNKNTERGKSYEKTT